MGYFFLRTVYNSVAMPVWTDNQILLLAMSSATYLGLRWQGNRTSGDSIPRLYQSTAPSPTARNAPGQPVAEAVSTVAG
jgi:hypothetical protein